jgi:hypothetical protein
VEVEVECRCNDVEELCIPAFLQMIQTEEERQETAICYRKASVVSYAIQQPHQHWLTRVPISTFRKQHKNKERFVPSVFSYPFTCQIAVLSKDKLLWCRPMRNANEHTIDCVEVIRYLIRQTPQLDLDMLTIAYVIGTCEDVVRRYEECYCMLIAPVIPLHTNRKHRKNRNVKVRAAELSDLF